MRLVTDFSLVTYSAYFTSYSIKLYSHVSRECLIKEKKHIKTKPLYFVFTRCSSSSCSTIFTGFL